MSNSRVKKSLIRNFNLQKTGMDFMGYEFHVKGSSYHHLIVPRRLGGKVTYNNGSILMTENHNYLHTIERYDKDIFDLINKYMMIQKEKEYLDLSDLRAIKSCLEYFERNYGDIKTKKGKQLIKDSYITKRRV